MAWSGEKTENIPCEGELITNVLIEYKIKDITHSTDWKIKDKSQCSSNYDVKDWKLNLIGKNLI